MLNTPLTNASSENSCGILLAPYASGRHKKVRNSRVWSFPIEGSDTWRFSEGPPRNSKVPLRPRANGDFVCLDLRQGRSPRAEARNRPLEPLLSRDDDLWRLDPLRSCELLRIKRHDRRSLSFRNAHQGLIESCYFFNSARICRAISIVKIYFNPDET